MLQSSGAAHKDAKGSAAGLDALHELGCQSLVDGLLRLAVRLHGRADDGGLDERQLVGCILRIDAAARDERELRDFAHAADGLERRGGAGVRARDDQGIRAALRLDVTLISIKLQMDILLLLFTR